MANNINWGKIYESTWFGSGVVDNNISWGIVYADLGGGGVIPSLLIDLQARATYYENVTCTTAILTSLETCP